MVKRIALFLVVNALVIVTISILINLIGLRPYLTARGIDYGSLLIMAALFGFVGAFISLQLSRWTAKTGMGVRLIDVQNPGSSEEMRLVQLVRRLCDQAGLDKLPEIGIYRSPEVNAFATGPSRRRALLAISSGLLGAMDSHAVEGVLGHEISHIVNGDMVTMTLVQGIVNTFVIFASYVLAILIEQAMSRDREGREEGGGMGFFMQYILINVLETALFFIASPIIYWFSRWREYRADAGSARLTGRETMIHALEQLKEATQVVDNRAPALSTFKINGRGRGLMALLFATHPPIDARIAALKRA